MTSIPRLPIRIETQSNLPLFAQLRQQITWLIASGELAAGDRLPPMRELAEQLGIHMHTVRQAYHSLEGDGLVETRAGRGTHVKPFELDTLVTAESSAPSHTIGVMVPDNHSFYGPFISSAEEAARDAGYMVVICIMRERGDLTCQFFQQLIAKRVDGIIAVSLDAEGLDLRFPTSPERPPIVYVDSPHFPQPAVLLDLVHAGYLGGRHLIEHGHERLAFVTAPLAGPNFADTYNGFQRALIQHSLAFEPDWLIEAPAFSMADGYAAGRRLLELRDPPKAVFVSGDLMAAGLIQALKEAGKRVPYDFAVVSKDGVDFAALIDPPLTTVRLPSDRMGTEAMKMVLRLLAHERRGRQQVVLECELIVRRSCGC